MVWWDRCAAALEKNDAICYKPKGKKKDVDSKVCLEQCMAAVKTEVTLFMADTYLTDPCSPQGN